jgi:hypothetical protein
MAKQRQLVADARRSPDGILAAYPSDESDYFRIDGWSSGSHGLGTQAPISAKAFAMPTDDRRRLND